MMADQVEKTQKKKKSFLSKVGSVAVSAFGLIVMTAGGNHVEMSGFVPNVYGTKGVAKLKKREGVPPPDHLRADSCRALYIPKHNGDMSGVLPIHDFTSDYRETLRDENIGSDKWRYAFSTMRKPQRDGTDGAEVAYLMEKEERDRSAEKQVINLRKRSLSTTNYDPISLSLPNDDSGKFTFTSTSTGVNTVTMSHQVPPIVTRVTTEGHLGYPAPWFTITSTESSTSYQWQIHPVEHGPLRYTLVELPAPGHDASAVQPENQHLIKAIYHNVGVGTSMGQPSSEGVLLLPAGKGTSAELEAAAVASLIGLLWRAREVQTVKVEVPHVEQEEEKPEAKKGRNLFRKSWNDTKEDDVIR